MEKINKIFIGNVLESYYASYEKLPENEKIYWTTYDLADNSRSLFYDGDNKIVVTPQPINTKHFEYVKKLMGWKNVHNVYPSEYSNSICDDIIKKSDLRTLLVETIKNNPNVELIPYRQTKEFYALINYLKGLGLAFVLPETPEEENKFIEKYFHSKRGFRHLWEMVKDPKLPIEIPFGFITENKAEAMQASYWFSKRGKDFVVKFNRGVQGIGVVLVKSADLSGDYDIFCEQLGAKLKEDMWNDSCIVVEEKIDIDNSHLGGSPNVELHILKDGTVIREYSCEQVLDPDGKTFIGVGINKEINKNVHIETAYKAAELYAHKLSELGYRGYLDMDLVYSKAKKIYAVESNMRRTGGTHIHELSKSLLGEDYSENYYVFSYEIKLEKTYKTTYEKVLADLKSLMFDEVNKTGVIIVNADLVPFNILPLVVIGKSRDEMQNLVAKVNACYADKVLVGK